jgi:hypothetical protein
MKYLLIFSLILSGCASGLTYQDDQGFLDSAQANSNEYPIKIGTQACQDLDKKPGLCAKRWPNNQDINLTIDPQSYNYTYHLVCSNSIAVDKSANVLSNNAGNIVIPSLSFGKTLSFTCILQVFPQDRSEAVSAQAEIRIVLYDPKYQAREDIYIENGRMILGQYARSSHICINSKCSISSNTTSIPVDANSKINAYSESYSMRFNHYSNQ